MRVQHSGDPITRQVREREQILEHHYIGKCDRSGVHVLVLQ